MRNNIFSPERNVDLEKLNFKIFPEEISEHFKYPCIFYAFKNIYE